MDDTDYALLTRLQEGLPLVPEPFREVAEKLDLTESEVIERLKIMKNKGIIRRFRARIDQRRVGITANALVAWDVPPAIKSSAEGVLASSPGVTHCYERQPVPGIWKYTLYTVHHGRSREEVLKEVSSVARDAGLDGYAVLFSTEEFKRVPAVHVRDTTGNPS
jgi:DNA-binding Lrp family transcriptional regulator